MSSGIACEGFEGKAATVHSQYGLKTAELPANRLIERSLGRENVVKELRECDVLIWDEISMSSELWNAIVDKSGREFFGGPDFFFAGENNFS